MKLQARVERKAREICSRLTRAAQQVLMSRVPAADGRLLWPNRDVCVRIGGKGSRGDGERTDGASDGFVRFLELMRVRSLCDDVDSVGVAASTHGF